MTQYEILNLAYITQKDRWNKAMEQIHQSPKDKVAIEMERIAYEKLNTLSEMMLAELRKAE